jgi:hypothetical protein
MKPMVILLLTLVLGSCVGYREKQVEFVTQEELAAREARIQCRALARTIIQMSRCDGR